ncbi:type I polyketide synthase, partial [Streptomyces marinisediminis]|uniref:type I polyketide synthase n=1 Tax=Streptomyces marinisediminis TaxID=2984864 RepID=UPI0022491A00
GALRLPPVRAWDVRRAPEALRHVSQARHVGKVVLTLPRALDPAGTALITGATGTLGAAAARHLATAHGIGSFLLLSRRGPTAPGAHDLVADLEATGARVTLLACDTADRAALADALTHLPPDRPLTAVVHTAGTLHDATLPELTPHHLDTVLRAKADTAHHLHELTRHHHDIAEFVLFSAGAGTFGGPGQGNYAAANVYLDQLAQQRHDAGLPARSIAWGMWEERSGMTAHLGERELARMTRTGLLPLPTDLGLTLLDTATTTPHPHLVAARLDTTALRHHTDTDGTGIPPLFRTLVRTPQRRGLAHSTSSDPSSWTQWLAGTTPEQGQRMLLDLVRTHVAAVLGHTGPDTIDAHRAFRDLGFDSLTAVEIRNRLTTATGLKLPTTLVFDHPTPTALTTHLHTHLTDHPTPTTPPATTPATTPDDDPIAVIGMSCRFPGGVHTPQDLWHLLTHAHDAIG